MERLLILPALPTRALPTRALPLQALLRTLALPARAGQRRRPAAIATAACILGAACAPRGDATPATVPAPAATALLPPPPPSPGRSVPGVDYTVAFDPDLSSVAARVCFTGLEVPTRLAPPMGAASPFLEVARTARGALAVDDAGVDLTGVGSGDCVEYAVDLDGVFRAGSQIDGVARYADAALLSPDWWLWPPEPRGPEMPIRVQFADASGVAVPWRRDDENGPSFRVPESAFRWKSQAAVGALDRHRRHVGTTTLDVTLVGADFGAQTNAVVDWVHDAATVAAELLDGFPVSRGLVLVAADPARSGNTFGLALQGGGPTAVLLMPATPPSAAALADDWTAVHELLHFTHPPMPAAEAWFFEGVVTYLTPVARARAGRIDARAAWTELFEGFDRGEHRSGTGRPLAEECRLMHRTGSYWRVYWAGAAVAFQWDVALHRRGRSLREGMAALAKAGLDPNRRWTGRDLMARLDAWCDCDLHTSIATPHLESATFPSLATLSDRLGIRYVRTTGLDGVVTLDDEAPEAALRDRIMTRGDAR